MAIKILSLFTCEQIDPGFAGGKTYDLSIFYFRNHYRCFYHNADIKHIFHVQNGNAGY